MISVREQSVFSKDYGIINHLKSTKTLGQHYPIFTQITRYSPPYRLSSPNAQENKIPNCIWIEGPGVCRPGVQMTVLWAVGQITEDRNTPFTWRQPDETGTFHCPHLHHRSNLQTSTPTVSTGMGIASSTTILPHAQHVTHSLMKMRKYTHNPNYLSLLSSQNQKT